MEWFLREPGVTISPNPESRSKAGETWRWVSEIAAIAVRRGVLPARALRLFLSPPADSVRFCAFDDYERWPRDHPRPAAKRLADLNVGEPGTVRMIYFLPNDGPFRQEVVDLMKVRIRQVQTFYAEQMQAHGYGNKTFRFETDAQGEPLVHRVDGQHPFSHYDNTLGTAVVAELEQTFDLDANIYAIVLGTDALRQSNRQRVGGVGWRHTKNGGALAVHAYFNPAVPIAEGQPPTVEITSPTRYQPGATSVPVRLRVRDSEGLHQVSLIGNAKPCRGVAGKREAVVEFNYHGNYWEGGFSNLSDHPKHHLFIVAVEAAGNVRKEASVLAEISHYEIATLRVDDAGDINSVSFSPDGMLASGSIEDGVKLWDVAPESRLGH